MVNGAYLIRHPEIEMRGKFIGITDVDLSSRGIMQIGGIIKYFENINLDVVISSPLKRCITPAQKLATIKRVPYIIDKKLIEINFGLWEGLNYKEIMDKFPAEWEEYMANPFDFTYPGGDSVSDYICKCVSNFNEYLKTRAGRILFFTHAGYIRSVISTALLKDTKEFFNLDCEYATGYLINSGGFLKIL